MVKTEDYVDGKLEMTYDKDGALTKVVHYVRDVAYTYPQLLLEPATKSGKLHWARAADLYKNGKVIEENQNYANDPARVLPPISYEDWIQQCIQQIRTSMFVSIVFHRDARHTARECDELLASIREHGLEGKFPKSTPVEKSLLERKNRLLNSP